MDQPQPPQGPWGEPGGWTPPVPQPVERPRTMHLAVQLMWVGAALSLLSIIFVFVQDDEIREAVRDSDSSLTEDEIDTGVAVAKAFAVVFSLVGAGLWAWMAVTNGQGKSWARVVASVFGGLNLFFTLIGFVGGSQPPLAIVASIVGLILAVTILVLLYRPESNRYYEAVSAGGYLR